MNAVDTNIFIYAQDVSAGAKHLKAQAILHALAQGSQTLLLWQVLGELVRKLRQWKDQGLLTRQEFDSRILTSRSMFSLHLPTTIVLDHALDLASRYSLSHWDRIAPRGLRHYALHGRHGRAANHR